MNEVSLSLRVAGDARVLSSLGGRPTLALVPCVHRDPHGRPLPVLVQLHEHLAQWAEDLRRGAAFVVRGQLRYQARPPQLAVLATSLDGFTPPRRR